MGLFKNMKDAKDAMGQAGGMGEQAAQAQQMADEAMKQAGYGGAAADVNMANAPAMATQGLCDHPMAYIPAMSQRIQRNIDGLQITTTFWWRRTLRGLAFTLCGVLGLSVFGGRLTLSAVCAVVGGFVATASRDLVAVVEKARR